MIDQPPRSTPLKILAGEAFESRSDPLAQHSEVAPRALAMISLRDCEDQLQRATDEPLRLALAAKSSHLALQAALTDALAGSASIGAYSDKLRAEYLAYFEASRDGEAVAPQSDRIMPFSKLLAKAMEQPMEWSGRKLKVTEDEMKALDRLTYVRDRVEHPRPESHFIEPLFIASTLPIAARLTLELLDVCGHHWEEDERLSVEETVGAITGLCSKID